MTIPGASTETSQPEQAAAPAPPSPYPTVQILQAAMAHRDSIRRSFESQREALAKAIDAQKQAVTQAVVNTQRRDAVTESRGLVTPEAATQRAMGFQEFLDALKPLIAEEVSRQMAIERAANR